MICHTRAHRQSGQPPPSGAAVLRQLGLGVLGCGAGATENCGDLPGSVPQPKPTRWAGGAGWTSFFVECTHAPPPHRCAHQVLPRRIHVQGLHTHGRDVLLGWVNRVLVVRHRREELLGCLLLFDEIGEFGQHLAMLLAVSTSARNLDMHRMGLGRCNWAQHRKLGWTVPPLRRSK